MQKKTNRYWRIVELLGERGPLSVPQVADAVGVSPQLAMQHIKTGVGDGRIVNQGGRLYGLPEWGAVDWVEVRLTRLELDQLVALSSWRSAPIGDEDLAWWRFNALHSREEVLEAARGARLKQDLELALSISPGQAKTYLTRPDVAAAFKQGRSCSSG